MLTLFAVLDQLMLCEEDDVGDYIQSRQPRHRAEPKRPVNYMEHKVSGFDRIKLAEPSRLERVLRSLAKPFR